MDSRTSSNYEQQERNIRENRNEDMNSVFETSWNVRSRRLLISGESGGMLFVNSSSSSRRRRRALSAPTVVGRDGHRRRRDEGEGGRSEWSYCKHGKLKQRFLSSQKNENNNNNNLSFSRQQSNGNSTIVASDFPDCNAIASCQDSDIQNNTTTTQTDTHHHHPVGCETIPIPSTSPCSLGGDSCSPRSLTSEEGISRTVERMLRISQEVETEYYQDFTLLARKLTDSWLAQDQRGVPTDFPSFCRKMDQILDTPSVQRSLSSQTPFRRILFIWLVNVLYTRELDYCSQLVRRLWGFALRYIQSIFFSLNLIRKSSSMLSFCCGSSNQDDLSRSRLSSMGNQSVLSNEESSLYSSTFDLDLSSSGASPAMSSGQRTSYPSAGNAPFYNPPMNTDSGNHNTTIRNPPNPSLLSGSRSSSGNQGGNESMFRVGSCPNSTTASSNLERSSNVDESPSKNRVRKSGAALWKSESFSSSVDAVEYDSAMTSANEILKSAQNEECELTSSSGIVRRKTKSEKKKSENNRQKSTNRTHAPLRRRESDVDSAVFVENDDVTHESLNSVNFRFQQQEQKQSEPRVSEQVGRQRSESASVSSVDDIREEHRQAAIRKRRALVGLRGRLPSFSEDMSQLSEYLNEFGGASAENTRADIDNSIGHENVINAQRNESHEGNSERDSNQNEGFNKSFYTTFTLCILAAIFISKK